MCLGIPGKIVEVLAPTEGGPSGGTGLRQGIVDFGGVRKVVCLSCVEEAVPGDHVIVHAGFAISRIDAEEAGRVFELLAEFGALEDEAAGGAPGTGSPGDPSARRPEEAGPGEARRDGGGP